MPEPEHQSASSPPSPPTTPSKARAAGSIPGLYSWKWAIGVFFVVAGVYAAVSGPRILSASDQFHFVDLAHSFMDGRLDTDTPRLRRNARPQLDEPRGLQQAVNGALTNAKGEPVGWNDWASYRVLQLKEGDEYRGVWPWGDTAGARANEFHTLTGDVVIIDGKKDIAWKCGANGRNRCNEKKYYISFPPFPAVVMLPFAALWGYGTNDVLITVLVAAFNAVLLFLLLGLLVRRGLSQRSMTDRLWLTALFAFGSVAFFCSVRGEVWFTALVFGTTLHLLYFMAALDARRPFWAGVALALGFATRTPLLFASVFFGMQLLWPASEERPPWGTILKKVVLFAIPTLAVGIGLMLYNHARFESLTEFGHTYLVEGRRQAIRDHGLFSFWFLNRNLQAMLINLPVLTAAYPFVQITKHGLGLFATTPPFALLARPEGKSRLRRSLWVAILAVAIPAAFYQNTGWAQFGYRFSMDWAPYLFALLAIDQRRMGWGYRGLILAAVLINLFGAITFGRAAAFYF